MEPGLMNEVESGNFFDQIDDLIEFPPDNECGDANLVSSRDCKDYPTWDEALQDCDPLFYGCDGSAASDLAAELSVPYEDIVQLEWLSTFVEDSFSGGGLTLSKENLRDSNGSSHNQFLTASPVSVVESSSSSSSSSSGGKTLPLSPSCRGPHRARSKRPRPATFNPRPPIHLISPSPSSVENLHAPESDNFAESSPIMKRRCANPSATHHDHPPQAVRKCLHCEITKTPQWRAGPMGPKTLCNACGVRFKAGRLFPEYRPAASPTFVPALHSNSHKKVLDMRIKLKPAPTQTAAEAKLVPKVSL